MIRLIETLVTILVAISLIRSVLKAFQNLFGGGAPPAAAPQSRPEAAAHTVLQQDPVCGTYVSADTSLKKLQGGRVIHFCSAECRDRYVA